MSPLHIPPRALARAVKLAFILSSTSFPAALLAQDAPALDAVVVTAPAILDAPLEVGLNPKAPQQPLPANDGAGLLKTVPGMNIIRKGGTGGDPVFRGMAGSRLNILLDGEHILGGCGGRMDPPTAYIFPDSYDRVTLLKGPQSVIHGPASAGVVMFERKRERFSQPDWHLDSALTVASFGRVDSFLDIKGGSPAFYAEGILTHARSDDYRDGKGDAVHSRYERQSGTAIVGLTPDENTRLELSAIRSDAEAAYADRGMDGSLFRRENLAFKVEKTRIGGWLDKVEAQTYYNYIDHVMDNYSLRHNTGTGMASNPDRKTVGGRAALTLDPLESLRWIVGADWQNNRHAGRSGGRKGAANYYRNQKRTENARFAQYGLFSELTWQASDNDRLIAGLRRDTWKAEDRRRTSPTFDDTQHETLWSGFTRYERDFSSGTAYVGLGHSKRAPDYWEIVKEAAGPDNAANRSVFGSLAPEKTTQLDIGFNWHSGPWRTFVSAFYGRIDDYILIQSRYRKGVRNVTVARNVDAHTWGGEAGVDYRFSPGLKGMASLAYVRGENDTDHHALGQMPPLEGRFSLDWTQGPWSSGALLRLVAPQNRYALNQGNIVGQDLGKSSGFGIFSLNGSYRWNKTTRLSFGVDNLFNKTYAEFVSKSGEASMIQGYEQTTRVNEPGRTLWVKVQMETD